MWRPTTLAFAAILTALAVAGCGATAGSPAPTPPASGGVFEALQRSGGGEVTVEVTWDGPAAGPVFEVTIDTHSVDLDPLDLADAELVNDRGDTLPATPWEAPKGGHHREGRLTFAGDAGAFLVDASWIELTINGVGGVPERVLRWEVPA